MKGTYSKTYSGSYTGTVMGIDVMSCVQGNTARVRDAYELEAYEPANRSCVVYEFRTGAEAPAEEPVVKRASGRSNRRANARRKAARARARKIRTFKMLFFGALLVMMFSLGGIASRAQSKKAPDAYKYYDTITVGYQENLLDVVEKYDDRNYYDTQRDYVEELCRINNLEFDGTSYPAVTPGTHLVVPYYSTELK